MHLYACWSAAAAPQRSDTQDVLYAAICVNRDVMMRGCYFKAQHCTCLHRLDLDLETEMRASCLYMLPKHVLP